MKAQNWGRRRGGQIAVGAAGVPTNGGVPTSAVEGAEEVPDSGATRGDGARVRGTAGYGRVRGNDNAPPLNVNRTGGPGTARPTSAPRASGEAPDLAGSSSGELGAAVEPFRLDPLVVTPELETAVGQGYSVLAVETGRTETKAVGPAQVRAAARLVAGRVTPVQPAPNARSPVPGAVSSAAARTPLLRATSATGVRAGEARRRSVSAPRRSVRHVRPPPTAAGAVMVRAVG